MQNQISEYQKYDKKLFITYIILLTGLSLIMMYIFLPSGEMYYGYDCSFHLQRIDALMKSFQNGTFPAYIDYDSVIGYGYATKWFYSDFLLIPFALIALFTDIIFAYKFLLFTVTILCGLSTYVFVTKWYKNQYAAIVAGLLYSFCLYKLYDSFERSAIGETMAFIFIPLALWGVYEIINGNYKKWYILSLSFSLLIFTHLITSVLMFGTLLLLLLINYKSLIKEPKRIYYLILSGVITIFLTAYYLIPSFEISLSDTFYLTARRMGSVEDTTLSFVPWLTSLIKGFVPSSFFELNYAAIGVIVIIVPLLRFFVREQTDKIKYADIGLFIGIIYVIACLSIFPWGIFPFSKMSAIQFPYRLLPFSSCFLAIAGGYYLSLIIKKENKRYIALLIISVLTVITMITESNIVKRVLPTDPPSAIFSHQNIGWGEYLPAKLPLSTFPNEKRERVDTKNNTTIVGEVTKNKGITEFNIQIENNDIIELPLLYYKGYTATINNKEIPVSESENGLIELAISESGKVKTSFTGTFIQKYSIYITILSFFLLIGYILINSKRINSGKEE